VAVIAANYCHFVTILNYETARPRFGLLSTRLEIPE